MVPAHGQVIDFTKVDDTNYTLGGKPVGQAADDIDVSQLKVQNIPTSARPYAEMLVPYYGGEQVPCLMYASNWRLRE